MDIGKKTISIREERVNGNSIFNLTNTKTECVTDVFDTGGNTLKFDFNIPTKKLTVFGDIEAIYVLYL